MHLVGHQEQLYSICDHKDLYSYDGVVNREKRYTRQRERYKERECNNRRTRENEQVIMTFGGEKFFR